MQSGLTTFRCTPTYLRVLVLFTLLIAAVSGAVHAQPGPQTVIKWAPWSDEDRELYEAVAEAYMARNPGIVIETYQAPSRANWIVQHAGGVEPDVVFSPSRNAHDYWQDKLVLDLTPYFEREEAREIVDDFLPFILDDFRVDGHLVAVPDRWGISTLAVNVDYLNQMGIVIDDRTWTFQDYHDVARRFAADQDGDGQTDRFATNEIQHWSWVWGYGGRYLDESRSRCVLNSPQAIQGLEVYAALFAEGLMGPGDWIAGTWLFRTNTGPIHNPIIAQAEFDFDVFMYPGGPAGKFMRVYADGLYVSSQTKQPEAVWDFLMFFMKDGLQIMMDAEQLRGPSPRRSQAVEWAKQPYEMKWIEAIQYGRLQPLTWDFTAVNRAFTDQINAVTRGEIPAASAVELVCQQVDSILAPFRNR